MITNLKELRIAQQPSKNEWTLVKVPLNVVNDGKKDFFNKKVFENFMKRDLN